jgi:GWxTD domain-containing protein
MVKPKVGTSVASALGVSVDGVKPGEYSLAVELADLAAGQSVVGERPLRIGSADAGQPGKFVKLDNLTEREQRYSREIQHLATPREMAYYKALSDSGKEAYLAWFWSRHNLTEFSRRMEAAEARFHTQKTSGVKTDRGRVYVKYGEPDAIEQKVIETDIRPREYWHYYTNGYVFVFIDIRGDGNFRLAWTNAKEEPPTGFEGYLSEEEQEQFK